MFNIWDIIGALILSIITTTIIVMVAIALTTVIASI